MGKVKSEGKNGKEEFLTIYPEFIHRNLQQLHFHNYESLFNAEWPPFISKSGVVYRSNSYGYRSEDFDSPQDLLILGCSQTLGVGIDDEFSWPVLLSNKLNTKFARLSVGGDSIQGQVIKAFEYFRVVGNPKIIVATFPLFRLELPILKDIFDFKKMSIDYNKDALKHKKVYSVQSINSVKNVDTYLKKPISPENIFTKEFSIYINFIFISMLEQYCRSNNIKIIWNIWEDYEKSLYKYIESEKSLNHILENYHFGDMETEDPFNRLADFESNLTCHSEYKNHPFFNKASDWTEENPGHWSVHKHIHVAESFYREIKNRKLFDRGEK